MQSSRYRTLAGAALVGVGAVVGLGFVTAEALFPGYSAADQTISALGADGAPPASRAVFNGAMVLAGLLTVLAAHGLHRVYERRLLTTLVAITGVGGFVGVGLFPAQTGVPHAVAALLAFAGTGATALAVARTVRGPFRYAAAGLGILELVALVLFVTLQGSTPLGIGGLERWVAYLGIVWVAAFGGFLLAGDAGPD